ncbi:phage integrase SAM-like domain-containing protein [Maribacter aurantiacus]|uniref:phage integrase SAM-like domain-containing protein n=1 Tax=Maribacter aurantiacus TaxID=1882343 RepID=UPI001375A51E|nr:phage integrase SAM-like domain-containing protein [Maribacter aurantiacus]
MDYKFILGLESFLRSYRPVHYQGNIGNNAVMKHIQRLRRMITLAFHMEWIERDPFVKFKPKLEKREREYLTLDELQSIIELTTSMER